VVLRSRQIVEQLLARADVRVGGNRPWDIDVRSEAVFDRILAGGSLGLGEAYVDGQWDCGALDEFFHRVLSARLGETVERNFRVAWSVVRAKVRERVAKRDDFEVGRVHYDLGNDLFAAMLDRRMVYSCAYWCGAQSLDDAQEAKLELLRTKLDSNAASCVLDIGCGWGGLARFVAERDRARVVGVTVSREQQLLGSQICDGLPIEIRLQDYREIEGAYDRIVSVGMFEHVGLRHHREFMEIAKRLLKPGGLFVLHTIANNVSTDHGDPWLSKYIFPNSMTPSLAQLATAVEGLFVVEDVQNIGPHYDPTLMAWHENFERAWPRLSANYDERFRRMWRYYLLMAAGNFRARSSQVLQLVLTHPGTRRSGPVHRRFVASG
jgi:cyclopropane-fatty-acyl-phospholipid synthase